MIAAPLPVLGLAIDPILAAHEKRLRRAARFALGLAVAGVLLTVFAVSGWVASSVEAFYFPHHHQSLLGLRLLSVTCPLLLLASLGLGLYARRTRLGKTAIIVALLPFGLALMLVLAGRK